MTVLKNDRGAAIIVVALFLLLLISFIGLAIDGGWITYVRNQAQARVDAAALAGVTAIEEGEEAVKGRAKLFSDRNGVAHLALNSVDNVIEPMIYDPLSSPILSAAPAAGAWSACNAVKVSTTISAPLFFSRFLNGGIPSTPITVSATAVTPRKPDLPVTLLGCNAGTTILKISQAPSPSDNSAFTTFTVSSANANDLREMVRSPETTIPAVKEGDCINVTNGQDNSVLKEIIDTYVTFNPPVCFLVPVTPTSGNPVKCQKITGFARICVTAVDDSGSGKGITAEVTCGVPLFGPAGLGVPAPPILVR